jgi:hypothetical protein
MSVDRDLELEDRLRARLRQLNGLEVTSYAALRDRRRRSSPLPLLLAVSVMGLVIIAGAQVVERLRESVPGAATNASRCGQLPTLQPTLGVPTPALASPNASTAATAETTVSILVWSDCVQPQTVTAHSGQLVQWAAAEAGIAPEIVLEDGTSLGQVRHVLEFRFVRPGRYRYHLREFPAVLGTIVVDDNAAVAICSRTQYTGAVVGAFPMRAADLATQDETRGGAAGPRVSRSVYRDYPDDAQIVLCFFDGFIAAPGGPPPPPPATFRPYDRYALTVDPSGQIRLVVAGHRDTLDVAPRLP